MDLEREKRLFELLQRVLSEAPDRRGPFMDAFPGLTADQFARLREMVRGAEEDDDRALVDARRLAARPEAADADSSSSEAGKVLGGFRLVRKLGEGGMGVVYEAEEIATGRHVALKLLLQERHPSDEAYARFEREARLAASIAHPNCVFVLGAFELDGIPAIAMELMSGGSLADRIRSGTPVPIDQAVRWAIQVLDGLEAAQSAGVIHRDVKPGNCFLGSDGQVKIGDFGIARSLLADEDQTRPGQTPLSPKYASPEQVRGERVDFRTDIYSAGATLYALLTGKPPFQGSVEGEVLARVLTKQATPPCTLRAEVPSGLQAVVQRAMAKRADERFQRYSTFRAALSRFLPRRRIPAGSGWRLAAIVIDWGLSPLAVFSISRIPWDSSTKGGWLAGSVDAALHRARDFAGPAALATAFPLLIPALCETLFGWSPGKLLLGLRVVGRYNDYLLRTRRAMRCVAFAVCLWVSFEVCILSELPKWTLGIAQLAPILLFLLPRRGGGLLGIHDLITSTMVIRTTRVSRPTERSAVGARVRYQQVAEEHGPAIGAFTRVREIGPTPTGRMLLARDSTLQRTVWLHEEDAAEESDQHSVLMVGNQNAVDLHWIGRVRTKDHSYAVWESPEGLSLLDRCGSEAVLTWPVIHRVLFELTEELSARSRSIAIEQVWIGDDGRTRVLPIAVGTVRAECLPPLQLLAAAASLLFTRMPAGSSMQGPASVPPTRHRRLTRSHRCTQLVVVASIGAVTVILLFALSPRVFGFDGVGLLVIINSLAIGSVISSLWGGFSFRLTGMVVHTSHGRPASMLRRVIRAALVAVPFLVIASGSLALTGRGEDGMPVEMAGLSILLVAFYGLVMVLSPERDLSDRICRTRLVLLREPEAIWPIDLPVAAEGVAKQLRGHPPFGSIEEAGAALASLKQRPWLVTRRARVCQLLLASCIPLGKSILIVRGIDMFHQGYSEFLLGWWFLASWFSFLSRGGISMLMCRIAVRSASGARASRLRCALRVTLELLPLALLLLVADQLERVWGLGSVATALRIVAAVAFAFGVAVNLCQPSRGLQDVLAGTRLVPA